MSAAAVTLPGMDAARTAVSAGAPVPADPVDRTGGLAVAAGTADRIARGRPAETSRALAGDARRFGAWCAATGRCVGADGGLVLPADAGTVADYVSHLADQGRAPATLERALSSVRTLHRAAGCAPPDTAAALAVIRGYREERAETGAASPGRARALAVAELRAMTDRLDTGDVLALRDRVVLVVGFAAYARRTTLARLDIADVVETDAGLDVAIRRSKADRARLGRSAALPYGAHPSTCPVRVTRAWLGLLASRGVTSGPLLRRVDRHGHIAGVPGEKCAGRGPADGRIAGEAVGIILERHAAAAGVSLDRLRAHSLRAGGATASYVANPAALLEIARHGEGWVDGSRQLLAYIRDVDRWQRNPLIGVGL